jgi:hypothetical protein
MPPLSVPPGGGLKRHARWQFQTQRRVVGPAGPAQGTVVEPVDVLGSRRYRTGIPGQTQSHNRAGVDAVVGRKHLLLPA